MKQEQAVDVGALNRRVQVQQQTPSQDASGGPSARWNTVYSCWASVEVQQSQLVYATAEFISKVTHRITMRWTSSIVVLPNMRIVYTEATTQVTHTYNVEAILNLDQRNRILVVLAYELEGAE